MHPSVTEGTISTLINSRSITRYLRLSDLLFHYYWQNVANLVSGLYVIRYT